MSISDVPELNMAINLSEKLDDKIGSPATKSSCSKSSNQSSRGLLKIDYSADGSISSSNCDKSKRKKNLSPYLTEDRIQMLSRITEKRLVRKKTTDFVSSYPLAVNIYKASSDEFKALKKSKKVKKSVLTLPNQPAPLPQACTVSDMNDSEYFDDMKHERTSKPKKKRTIQTYRRPRINKAMEVFDRDAEYCSRLNIDLDCSSTDMINQFTGDGKKLSIKRRYNKPKDSDIKAHDVWAMLRNINRFPFRSSPPLSDDSIASIKKNTYNKRRNGRMGTKYIETCTTEEFTFFSNSVDKSAHNSQSSLDCITVIDKQDEYQALCGDLKVLKNKFAPNIKSQKNMKKIKCNVKAKLTSGKVSDGGDKDKLLHHNDVNSELKSPLSKSLQNKEQSQENKLMVPYDARNQKKLGCTFNCQNNISRDDNTDFNVSEDHLNSDSCNGDMIKDVIMDQNTSKKISSCDLQGPIIGITKVVLSKGPNIVSTKKADTWKRKPRSVTTMPSAAICPKLTQTEIKRRLANIKFPLVILAKDQLTSAPFQVTNYEAPQFASLNEHVWPFMQNWQKQGKKSFEKSSYKRYIPVYEEPTQGMKGDCVGEKTNEVKINKTKNTYALKDKNEIQPVPVTNADNINTKAQKTKPMRQFKERMLQFLHKKTSFDDDFKKRFPKELSKRREVYNNAVDVSTNTQRSLVLSNEQYEIINKKEKILNNNSMPYNLKQPLAKVRWRSDFIDNVIKKLKSGVYYNQDERNICRNRCCTTKEDSVQTDIIFPKHDLCKNCIQKCNPDVEEINNCEPVPMIPGFDDRLSDLQIESINKNQIAIKHCITNIIVQFDVATPSEINPMLYGTQSVSCIPVSITENHTKIFKSQITIVNAILPAELCSIFPRMMRKIIDTKVIMPKIVDKVESHLSTIAELTRCESGYSMKQLIPVHIEISPEVRNLGQGKFLNNVPKITTNISERTKISHHYFEELYPREIADLLPNINTRLLFMCQINPIVLLRFESNQAAKHVPGNDLTHQKKSNCMELQPYLSTSGPVVHTFTRLNFIEVAARILNNQYFDIQLSIPMLNQLNNLSYKNHVNIKSMGLKTDNNNVCCIISDVTVDSLYDGFQGRLKDINKTPSILKLNLKNQLTNNTINTVTKRTDRSLNNKCENSKNRIEYCVTNNKNKKRSFVKLYKKCKSMSNISNERSSTGLRKITNLDNFFLALGSAKTLASVFDGTAERKILTSIKEMKNWINDITPRQALLVMLLANKKDTSNLVRYRPVILQGIAVKRITRASELDMEIEVIERENLNTFSQYEGISYLPASVENQDSLLEELFWIAKTTASDYQKPFDESSERLIKSLLEKRKRLNPSYLRVMARYVGLGLLKSPKQ